METLGQKLRRTTQLIYKSERQRRTKMDELGTSSREARRARSHSLIQIGALVDKAGLLNTFEIGLGLDLQRDPDLKHQVAALYKGLTVLNEMAQSDEAHLPTWAIQGLQLLGKEKRKNIL